MRVPVLLRAAACPARGCTHAQDTHALHTRTNRYPSIDGTKLPWLIAYAPTEPILKVTRKVGGLSTAVFYVVCAQPAWSCSCTLRAAKGRAAHGTHTQRRLRRQVIPLLGGVDVTPIVWVGLLSFFSEILLGPQGLLILIQRQSGLGL